MISQLLFAYSRALNRYCGPPPHTVTRGCSLGIHQDTHHMHMVIVNFIDLAVCKGWAGPLHIDTVSRRNTCLKKGADLKYINKAAFYTVTLLLEILQFIQYYFYVRVENVLSART